jgi:hypothetical protein
MVFPSQGARPVGAFENAPDRKRSKTMRFLFKGIFWFSVVLLALPIMDGEGDGTGAAGPEVEFGATLNAIGVAVGDIRSICERQPEMCETGSETLTALGHRARDGARIAYQYLDGKLAGETAGSQIAAAPEPVPAPAIAGVEAGTDDERGVIASPALDADPRATGTVPTAFAPEINALGVAAALLASVPVPAPEPAR